MTVGSLQLLQDWLARGGTLIELDDYDVTNMFFKRTIISASATCGSTSTMRSASTAGSPLSGYRKMPSLVKMRGTDCFTASEQMLDQGAIEKDPTAKSGGRMLPLYHNGFGASDPWSILVGVALQYGKGKIVALSSLIGVTETRFQDWLTVIPVLMARGTSRLLEQQAAARVFYGNHIC